MPSRKGRRVLWVLVAAAWVGLAVLTSRVAVRRDHDRVLWLVLGLVFPGAALLALLLGFPRTHATVGEVAPDVRQALERSRVARVLVRAPGTDEASLVAATGMDEDRVAGELRTLRILGLARRHRDGTWELSPRAVAVVSPDPRPEGGPDAA